MDPKLFAEQPPEEMTEEQPAMAGGEDCVPLDALAMPDEGDKMQNPEVGDAVEYTTTGKVTRIEGDKAYVKRETVNGKPVNENEQPPAEADEMAALQQQAADTGNL